MRLWCRTKHLQNTLGCNSVHCIYSMFGVHGMKLSFRAFFKINNHEVTYCKSLNYGLSKWIEDLVLTTSQEMSLLSTELASHLLVLGWHLRVVLVQWLGMNVVPKDFRAFVMKLHILNYQWGTHHSHWQPVWMADIKKILIAGVLTVRCALLEYSVFHYFTLKVLLLNSRQ